jgi:hypothetical protein
MEPHIFAILVLAANHRAETHISAQAVTWLIGINLLQNPVFVHPDIL